MPGNIPGQIKKTRWFTCLFIWWVLVSLFYMYIAANETEQLNRVRAVGQKAVIESATKAGLPLLERDVQALTGLAQEVAKQKDVVNVSIIDHKNKIIAYTNPDLPVPPVAPSVERQNGVSYWQHPMDDGAQAICFSADINYAATKIGQVLLVMAAGDADRLRRVFFLVALGSLLLMGFVLLIIDFSGIRPLTAAVKERLRTWIGNHGDLPDGREVICPVCGSYKPLTRSFLLEANLDRYTVVRPARDANSAAPLLRSRGINLGDISHREDLGWLRRQMITRCADIIKKLAGE